MSNIKKWRLKEKEDSIDILKQRENDLSTDSDEWEEELWKKSLKKGFDGKINGIVVSKIKTSLCRNFELKGYCPYNNKCKFAHGVHEIRKQHQNFRFRTKLCIEFKKNGYCLYGSCCNYLHSPPMYYLSSLVVQADPSFATVILNAKNRSESRLLAMLNHSE